MTSVVRPLLDSDRAAWNPLWQGYLDFYQAVLPVEQTELTWTRLTDTGHPLVGLGIEQDGGLRGFAHVLFHDSTWSPSGYAYLEDLFVDPTARGEGLGDALIKGVYDLARSRKATRVHWMTQTANPARKLYDRHADVADFVQYRSTLTDTGAL